MDKELILLIDNKNAESKQYTISSISSGFLGLFMYYDNGDMINIQDLPKADYQQLNEVAVYLHSKRLKGDIPFTLKTFINHLNLTNMTYLIKDKVAYFLSKEIVGNPFPHAYTVHYFNGNDPLELITGGIVEKVVYTLFFQQCFN